MPQTRSNDRTKACAVKRNEKERDQSHQQRGKQQPKHNGKTQQRTPKPQVSNGAHHRVSLSLAKQFEPLAAMRGVSRVARGRSVQRKVMEASFRWLNASMATLRR